LRTLYEIIRESTTSLIFFKNILAAEKAIASADFPENTKRLPP
jgi:hypothetical protein